MKQLRCWLQGKKTILGGALVVVAGVLGVGFGQLSPVNGLTLVGAGLSVCGWSAKANRHQAQILAALEAIAKAGLDMRAGDEAGARRVLEMLVAEACTGKDLF